MWCKSLFVVVVLAAAAPAIAETGGPEITAAWARATPGKAENGAAYMTIASPTADRVTGIATPAAKKAELHTMTMEGGLMRMRPLDGLDVPAGQPVTLKPGGIHVMLLGLTQPLRDGQSFPLTVTFEKGGQREVTVAVAKPGAMGPEGTAGMPMHH